ncbi:hypothetical protein TNCV_2230971 [Trichonephila clavipes]|uniref:Uncharacterized protein n=1 Tax=Trichonephila clavipes TaxID=2585209 RepID=A0A8X6WDZ7_TRICX|nr:hypothetical protein TNCV_2230971 [Trichonephila clavipes]
MFLKQRHHPARNIVAINNAHAIFNDVHLVHRRECSMGMMGPNVPHGNMTHTMTSPTLSLARDPDGNPCICP